MEEICNKSQCTACKACMNICPQGCISMQADEMDALYPVIDESKCVNCKLCIKTCPSNKDAELHDSMKVFAAWSKDENIRNTSASGGVVTELYNYYTKEGKFIAGVRMDGYKARYMLTSSPKELSLLKNSKYVYSDTSDIYNQIKIKLEQNKKDLFVGLPCQVAGLLGYLRKKYENLTIVDIVCHGVPPEEYLRQHVTMIDKRATDISFRDPEFGTCSFIFTLRNKKNLLYMKGVYEDDVYQLGYHKALIYRDNCFHCRYAQPKRLGDITVCDFSGVGAINPITYDRLKVSCVLVNTEKGKELLKGLKDRLFLDERPREEAFKYEPQLNHPYQPHSGRPVFEKIYRKSHDFEKAAKKALKVELYNYRMAHPSLLRKVIRKLRAISHKYVDMVLTYIGHILKQDK